MKKTKTQMRVELLTPHIAELDRIAATSHWGRLPIGVRGGYHYVNVTAGTYWIVRACRQAGALNVIGIDYWSGSNPTPSTAMSADVFAYVANILRPANLL